MREGVRRGRARRRLLLLSVLEPQWRGSHRRMRLRVLANHVPFVFCCIPPNFFISQRSDPWCSLNQCCSFFSTSPRSSRRPPPSFLPSNPRSSPDATMVSTTRKLKLGPPLVVQHDDVCLGLVGKASTCTWWPLRVQGSGHDPAVDVIFFGDSKTGRLARNKLRPFADLEEIPSRFIPKRCVRMRTRRVPPHRTLHTKEACPPHRAAALHTKTPSRRRPSGWRPPSLRTSRHRMISTRLPRCRGSSS